MKILGAGLSKTGTTSLARALGILGYETLHCDQQRLNDIIYGVDNDPNFRLYDDVDAVTDLPTAYFYRELVDAYPDLLVILTVRPEDAWWRSVGHHFNRAHPVTDPVRDKFRWRLRNLAYGSPVAHEFLFRKRFREHNEAVIATVDPERLLVMDITTGDGWEKLCGFLREPIPGIEFPHENKTMGTPSS
ncbi:sulfotransferase family protein [Actinopolymorpha sp. B11F2]|uniref:sulfotransferase family protein n=1 Tax=Actinopolymorpha sp. B11F2 TaxID=3160862 RepID=UPI0032E5066E